MLKTELILVLAGLLGGIINAIAGGGAILIFPALLFSGLAPVSAAATVSLAVFPGTVTSVVGYKSKLKTVPAYFLWLMLPSIIGAAIGAQILIHIDPKKFEAIVPWLVLSAVLLLALQTKIHHAIVSQKQLVKTTSQLAVPILYLSVLVLSIYGGFFGAGFGLMLLAVLGLSRLRSSYEMSAVKNFCGVAITLVAGIYFITSGLANWHLGLLAAVGTAIGGYSGSKLSQKVSSHSVHNISLIIGILITIYLFVR
jgi:uncharacterized membrane protein YfcA